MDVLLLRHGKAERPSIRVPSDYQRPLTAIGRKEVERVGRAIRRMGINPDVLATSPLVRAAQTAGIVSGYVGVEAVEWDELKPETDPRDTIDMVEAAGADTVLLVGHEPHMSSMISQMISDGSAVVSLKKGGLACVRVPALGPGRLRYVLTPRQLAMIS